MAVIEILIFENSNALRPKNPRNVRYFWFCAESRKENDLKKQMEMTVLATIASYKMTKTNKHIYNTYQA